MDLFLRRESGLDVAAQIMARSPRPILIVTIADTSDAELIFKAVEVGVLDVCSKLPSPMSPLYKQKRERLVRLIKTLATVPVVHRSAGSRPAPDSRAGPTPAPRADLPGRYKVLLIGASTGGPPALCTLLSRLSAPFQLPIVIVQHMAEGFMKGFVDWLGQVTSHRLVMVEQPEVLVPGKVYLPPDSHHLRFSSGQRLALSAEPPRSHQRPSIDILFESAAAQIGNAAIGIILTGMGGDGAAGLLSLKQAGSLTIAQAPHTCVVDSMPRRAIDLGAAGKTLELEAIPTFCNGLVSGY
jgi:two-component system chemotaxis response regulator CheB